LKTKFTLYLPIILALVLIAGILLGYKLKLTSSGNAPLFDMNLRNYSKLNDVVNYIVQEYVDSVSKDKLTEEGIQGILDNLDPHSQYITAKEYHEVNDPLLGNFEGIGIQFRIEKDTIIVIQTIMGGPSEKTGLAAGDRIVYVDDSLVAGVTITNRDAMKKLKGKRGTKVKVGIFRRGIPDIINFIITRDVIPTYSIDIAFMPSETTGYIKISKFSATTYDEFNEAVQKLENEGMQNLIIDLRGNTGGYLKAAIDISDEFLGEDELIVYTDGKNQPKELFYATNKGRLENNGVVVLIDGASASASEIVAGAIQDNDRGLIIGRRSFGKGLVQRQLDLLDGSAVRLTIARYYTPTGRCIQKPYDPEKGFEEYYSESYHRYLNGELEVKDSIHFNDSLKYVTPGGKIVYGGGGIMPDIFIPIERGEEFQYYNSLVQKSLIFRYAFEYTDKNRAALKQYTDFENFNKHFNITDVLFDEFISFGEKNGVTKDPDGIKHSMIKIEMLLKAYIGRNLYDNEGFYPIYLSIDDAFNAAITSFSNANNTID
jgi:carboxyl-terminal processing protease